MQHGVIFSDGQVIIPSDELLADNAVDLGAPMQLDADPRLETAAAGDDFSRGIAGEVTHAMANDVETIEDIATPEIGGSGNEIPDSNHVPSLQDCDCNDPETKVDYQIPQEDQQTSSVVGSDACVASQDCWEDTDRLVEEAAGPLEDCDRPHFEGSAANPLAACLNDDNSCLAQEVKLSQPLLEMGTGHSNRDSIEGATGSSPHADAASEVSSHGNRSSDVTEKAADNGAADSESAEADSDSVVVPAAEEFNDQKGRVATGDDADTDVIQIERPEQPEEIVSNISATSADVQAEESDSEIAAVSDSEAAIIGDREEPPIDSAATVVADCSNFEPDGTIANMGYTPEGSISTESGTFTKTEDNSTTIAAGCEPVFMHQSGERVAHDAHVMVNHNKYVLSLCSSTYMGFRF